MQMVSDYICSTWAAKSFNNNLKGIAYTQRESALDFVHSSTLKYNWLGLKEGKRGGGVKITVK